MSPPSNPLSRREERGAIGAEGARVSRRGRCFGRMTALLWVKSSCSLLTLVTHFKKVMPRQWAYLTSRLAFTLARFHLLVEWDRIPVDEWAVSTSLSLPSVCKTSPKGYISLGLT